MATARKISRKELKKPDEFVQTGQKAARWAGDNARTVFLILAAVFAAGILVTLGAWWADSQENEAAEALGRALEVMERPVLSEAESADRDDPYFTSEEEKRKAVRAAFEAVRKEHPGTEAAAMAELHLAALDYDAEDWDAALERYQRFLAEASPTNQFRSVAYDAMVNIYLAKGDKEAALRTLEEMERSGNAYYLPFALARKAELLYELGRIEEARTAAQTVVDSYASSPARAAADALLRKLPPAPEPAPNAEAEPASETP
ncbi:MAG: hypothetical protein D6729_14140 [Deltaproteobacteria bacterium]|nr:MAG: hypothetical protein D6729_14140 [Deltaproteobacteria bacterium]